MENPASWTNITRALDKAIRDHQGAQEAGAIGGSLAKYIETVVFDPIFQNLTKPVTNEEWFKYAKSSYPRGTVNLVYPEGIERLIQDRIAET